MPFDYSIVIPVYNEEKIIENTIKTVNSYLVSQNKSFEIIVADDGSKDNTQSIIRNLMRNYKALKLVINPINLGRGAALNNAFKNSQGKILVYLDADLAIDLDLFPKLMSAIESENVDIAIGSKHLPNSVVEYPKLRRFFSKAYSYLARLFLGSYIRDYQCGFKAFKRDVILTVIPYVKSEKWSWDTEVLVKSQWLGYKIKELPANVVNIYARESKVSLFRDIKSMGWELIRLFIERINFKFNDY